MLHCQPVLRIVVDSDGAVDILTFVETVRFLRKDSARTLSPICTPHAFAYSIAKIANFT